MGKIVVALHVQPKLGGGPEEVGKAQGSIHGYSGRFPDQSLNAGSRHIEATGELTFTHVERDQELVFQYLTGMARILHRRHVWTSLSAVSGSL